MFDTTKVKGRIYTVFGNQRAFAKAVGETDGSVSRYLTGKRILSQETIEVWANVLGIDKPDIGDFFFARIFDETQK